MNQTQTFYLVVLANNVLQVRETGHLVEMNQERFWLDTYEQAEHRLNKIVEEGHYRENDLEIFKVERKLKFDQIK